MEFYIKKDNKLHSLGSISNENFQEIAGKVIELENKLNQIQASLDQ